MASPNPTPPGPQDRHPGAKEPVARGFLVVGLAILLYAVVCAVTGGDDLLVPLRSFRIRYLLPLLALSGLNYTLRYLRWEYLLRRLGIALPGRDSRLLFLSTFVMVITPGKVGEAFKAGILQERFGVALSRGLPVVLAERLYDFLGVLVAACAGLLFWRGTSVGMGAGLVAVALLPALVLLLSRPSLHGWIFRRAGSQRRLARFGIVITDALESMRRLLGCRVGAISLAISTAAWLAECGSLWLVCRACAVPIGPADACFIYAAGTLVGSLSFLPGGLGGTEATLIWLLKDIGMDGPAAVAIAIIVRLATLWLAVALGLVLLPAARRAFTHPHTEPDAGDRSDYSARRS